METIEHDTLDSLVTGHVQDYAGLDECAVIHAMCMASQPTVYRQREANGDYTIGPWYCDEDAHIAIRKALSEGAERYAQKNGVM